MGRGIEKWIEVLSTWMLICLCFLFLCGSACGEETEPIVPKHTFSLGVGVSCFDWEEDAPVVGDVGIDGLMYEVVGGYTYHDNIMFSLSLNYSIGDLDYDGFLQAIYPDGRMEWERFKSEKDTYVVEGRGLLGYDYVFRGKHMVTPFLGIGYRYWNDDGESVYFSEKEVEYWYSPIGIRSYSPLSNRWNWGMSLEYDLFWDGEAYYHELNDPRYDFDSGYGVRFSLRFSTQFTENVGLAFEPYITYWKIDEADWELLVVSGVGLRWGIEPVNDTTTYGLRVSVEF